MYHSPAAVLLQHLLDETVVTSSGEWQGFENFAPDDNDIHDNSVAVFDTSGVKDGRIHRTGESVEHPGVMVLVRARTHPEGYRKAKAVADTLDAIVRQAVTLDARNYEIQAAAKRPTLYLGRETDSRQRYRFTVNATLTIKELI